MNYKKGLLLAVVPLMLGSCQPTGVQPYQKTISPAGAPAICFYDQGNTGTFFTNSKPANVLAELSTDNYGMVVFDFYNGLKAIKSNNLNYKLARILTGGNLYLVGIDKTEAPTKDDHIVSFGQGLLPDLAYKKLYSEDIVNATTYVNAVTDAQAVLASGKYEGEDVDYVLIAQPALFATMSNQNAATRGRLTVIESLRTKWKETFNQDAIPQAGLFVNTTYYNANKQYFDEQFALIDQRIETAIEDVETVKRIMDNQIPSLDDQKNFFGFNSNVAKNVQSSPATPNGFALVNSSEAENIDISAFLNALGVEEDYSSYIL